MTPTNAPSPAIAAPAPAIYDCCCCSSFVFCYGEEWFSNGTALVSGWYRFSWFANNILYITCIVYSEIIDLWFIQLSMLTLVICSVLNDERVYFQMIDGGFSVILYECFMILSSHDSTEWGTAHLHWGEWGGRKHGVQMEQWHSRITHWGTSVFPPPADGKWEGNADIVWAVTAPGRKGGEEVKRGSRENEDTVY